MAVFKAIKLERMSAHVIQKYFDEGWEYVDGFSQSVSITTGNGYTQKEYGEILIILKQDKIEL